MSKLNQWTLAALVAAALTGCGSTVKLDDVVVEDKAGQSVSGSTANSGAASQAKSTVTTLTPANNGGADMVVAGGRVVYFDYDSFAIRPEFQSVIEAHAKVIKGDKARKASIQGHTDERGGREYNLALGQKRAEAVRKALTLLGVSDGQLEAVSFGKEKPAVVGDSESAMEKNRRAEITVR